MRRNGGLVGVVGEFPHDFHGLGEGESVVVEVVDDGVDGGGGGGVAGGVGGRDGEPVSGADRFVPSP